MNIWLLILWQASFVFPGLTLKVQLCFKIFLKPFAKLAIFFLFIIEKLQQFFKHKKWEIIGFGLQCAYKKLYPKGFLFKLWTFLLI